MVSKGYFVLCASLLCLFVAGIYGQGPGGVIIPKTKFSCNGRPSGYYADVETGCQVYHMCDGLGRQFSFVCPNTTLFQQRMLVCDHWYMVNCSKSESNFGANLLIGQRDKPFVSDSEMHNRTPRPDILVVPPGNNYYEGLKEAESKFPYHPDNSISGSADSLSNSNNNGLDTGKDQYRPPTSWSTGTQNQRPTTNSQYQPTPTTNGQFQSSPTTNGQFQPSPTTNGQYQRPTTNGQSQQPTTNGQYQRPTTNGQSQQPTTNIQYQRPTTNGQYQRPTTNGQYQRPTTNSQFQPRPTSPQPTFNHNQDNIAGAASQDVSPTIQTSPGVTPAPIHKPSQDLIPPFRPSTTTDANEEYIDIRMNESEENIVNFINRFDPNSPEPNKNSQHNTRPETGKPQQANANQFGNQSHKTAMTRTEIINLNRHLPQGQNSGEDDRTPRRQDISKANSITGFNSRINVNHGKNTDDEKTLASEVNRIDEQGHQTGAVREPSKVLELPKRDYSEQSQTTVGPPIYYDWKWAVPAFDLEPPKFDNTTRNVTVDVKSRIGGRSPFENVTTTTPKIDLLTSLTEYNISSYYVPDYVFPLDNPHPGYENENAESSFLVKLGRSGRSYGENPSCPQCHPAYLEPGKCEPCIKR